MIPATSPMWIEMETSITTFEGKNIHTSTKVYIKIVS